MAIDILSSSLDILPNELLHQILSYCSATSVLVLSRTCRRLHNLIDNHTWLHLCKQEFHYWSPEHDFKVSSEGDISRVNWRSTFLKRRRKQQETTELLNSILQSQSGRIDKFQQVVDLGYDAKDCLLMHFNIDENAEDWLARRWYSDAVLGCLHRSMAIKEWSKIHRRDEQSLERALGAFDMFVLHDRHGDFGEIQSRLDAIAKSIIDEDSNFNVKTTRQKALVIASYLTRHSLVGVRGNPEQTYHNLQNNFIGFALYDSEHSSLPLQTAAIYCSIARRLGVQASPCALPFHVFVVVRPSNDVDLDGGILSGDSGVDGNMYLDPFKTDQEIDVSILASRLYSIATPREYHSTYFEPAPVNDLILRTGRNIITSIQDNYRNNAWLQAGSMESSTTVTDLEGAFYGALWSALLFGIPTPDGHLTTTLNRRAYLPPFIEHFETHFSMDAALIERYVIPTFQHLPECTQLRESVRVMRSVDIRPKVVKARTKRISERVHYRVGQVFRHRRYGYTAVITGWDIECSADEQWMQRMRVQDLQRGQHQSFYHVLVEDKSVRYVAEENIEIIMPKEPHSLMPLAGRHFKRWDYHLRRFISNIKDEYPDD